MQSMGNDCGGIVVWKLQRNTLSPNRHAPASDTETCATTVILPGKPYPSLADTETWGALSCSCATGTRSFAGSMCFYFRRFICLIFMFSFAGCSARLQSIGTVFACTCLQQSKLCLLVFW
jgi:hypothetical protein